MSNPFQAAVTRFRELGVRGHIQFLKGNSIVDCDEGDEGGSVQVVCVGLGCTFGDNLDEAVDAMVARVTGAERIAAASPAPEAAPAAPVKRKSKK